MFICKKQLKNLEERVHRQYEALRNQRYEVDCLNRQVSLLKFAIAKDDNLFLSLDQGHFCIIKRNFAADFENGIDLHISLYNTPSNEDAFLDATVSVETKDVYIDDFQTKTINSGYGTALMNNLIEYAKKAEMHTIRGKLREVDTSTHKDRLFHFYQKFGFKISETKEPQRYTISLAL